MEKSIRVNLMKIFFSFLWMSTYLLYGSNTLRDIQTKNNELILYFSKNIEQNSINKFSLSHPKREIYDFKNTHLKNLRISQKFPKGIRIAQFSPSIVRIVLDDAHQAKYAKSYVSVLNKKEYRIPLHEVKARDNKNAPHKHKKKSSTKTINEIFAEVEMLNSDERLRVKLDSKVSLESDDVVTSFKYNKLNANNLIVIDAGHGGHDSGAVGGKKKEKDLVLSIAKRTAKALTRLGYQVYLTRESDRFLKLSQRTKIADKKGAVAFISIHANSVVKSRRHIARGIETFFLQNTRDAKSQRIASRENAAVLKGAGSKLSKRVIVDSVLNGPKIIESNKLAIDVQRRIMSNVHRIYKDVKDGGVRHAPFYVLVGASRPSILVEVGYISHKTERKRLFTSRYQKRIAKGIAEGLDAYLNNRKKEIDFD